MEITHPPDTWLPERSKPANLFEELTGGKPDPNSKLAIIIKEDGTTLYITKATAIKNSKLIASGIINEAHSLEDEQLRIFACISSSEASFYLMLASSFLGANHCICFEDLSENAITNRINIFQPHIIFASEKTAGKLLRARGKSDFKEVPICDTAKFKSSSSSIINNQLKPAIYNPNDILFTLFTSGSTGLPKAIRHSAYRFSRYAASTSKHFFGLDNESIIFTATDAGWINGHTYAFYGPLLCGSTTIISERLSEISSPECLELILTTFGVTCFYASVTLLRAIRQDVLTKRIDPSLKNLSKLERIGSCGEPLANDIGEWVINYFSPNRKSVVNTYFQTETGGVITAPRDEDGFNCDYSNVGKPNYFVEIKTARELLKPHELIDESINPDELLIPYPWQGIFHSVISDRSTNYFTKKGYFRLHDTGYFGDDGSLFIGGRNDDVMNVAGHRVGSSEIENTVIKVKGVFESCAVAVPDETMGSSIALFYSANTQIDEIEIRSKISEVLSEYHQPQYIFRFNNLPKTKSGKIMRRAMRSLAAFGFLDPESDYSTFSNRDDFIKDCSSFLEFWINRTIGSSMQMLFDLDLFCSEMQITSAKHLALPTLAIAILQTLENWCQELGSVSSLHFSLKNNSDTLYTCDIGIDASKHIVSITKDISDSALGTESCLYDTNVLLMSSNHDCNKVTNISLMREQNTTYFNIGIKIQSSSRKSIKHQIISDLLHTMNAASKDQSIGTSLKSNTKQKLKPRSEPNKQIKYKENFGESHLEDIRCHKCQASLSKLNEERGLEAYLLPIIRSDNKNAYICDLCAAGF